MFYRWRNRARNIGTHSGVLILALLVTGCGSEGPIAPDRYTGPDELFSQVAANVANDLALQKVVEIDHSRLGAESGSSMPPAHVLLFTNIELEIALLQLNPLVGIELPLRVLAYEEIDSGDSKVIYNSYDYIESRHKLPDQSALRAIYEQSMSASVRGIPAAQVGAFDVDHMERDGIVTVESLYNFEQTMERVQEAIAAQDDTVSFVVIDYREQAAKVGVELPHGSLILFGGPAPGAKAMNKAPTLGLDAFCQKFFVWQDEAGKVHLSFNDLLALAERQGVGKSVALRFIQYRLMKTFTEAVTG